jgi:hypothetical protein
VKGTRSIFSWSSLHHRFCCNDFILVSPEAASR